MFKQVVDYVERMMIYKKTMSGFRQNYSTSTLLLKLKDDIIKAMGRAEVFTLAVMADLLTSILSVILY